MSRSQEKAIKSVLPPLRNSVLIEFWSLRNAIGANGGVVLDVDTKIRREWYRKKTTDGWKWVIKGYKRLIASEWFLETDQECLDNMENPTTDVEIIIGKHIAEYVLG